MAAVTVQNFGAAQITAMTLAVAALLLSAFVSGSEISFFSLSPQQAEEIEDTRKADRIRRLLDMPDRLLATILIANNLVNVTIVVLMTFALTSVFEAMPGWASFLLQTVILTFLILLFGEILPKLVANTSPVRWAKFAVGGISTMMKLFWPISSMMVSSTKFVNKVVSRQSRNITTDELGQALEITDVQGAQDKEMLEGILRFGDTTASEIMTPRVDITGLWASMTFDEVMEVVVDKGYSRLPVFGESQDDVRGVLYARDLLPHLGEGARTADVNWLSLVREAYFVPEQRMIDDLLEDFRQRKIHIAIVIDEYGGTQGIVTLEDILEEIVGEIDDEYDQDEDLYKKTPDGAYIFDAKIPMVDFCRITDTEEEEFGEPGEEAETLAGLLLEIKGDFPALKETITCGRFSFTVLQIERHRIRKVRVTIAPPAETENPETEQ